MIFCTVTRAVVVRCTFGGLELLGVAKGSQWWLEWHVVSVTTDVCLPAALIKVVVRIDNRAVRLG